MGGTRVLHVSQPVRGGTAAVVAQFAGAQAEAGWEVTVACPAAQPEDLAPGALARTAARRGAAVVNWEARRAPGRTVLAEARSLRLLIRHVRPDLVHLHSSKAGLAGRLAVRGRVPVLFQPHAWSFEAVSGPFAAASSAWERHAARWADRIVCVSEGEHAAGLRAGIRGSYAVVPNGVDVRRFAPQASDAPAREDGPLIVVVGRLCRQKGQDLLLDAWPAITARHPHARLVLVGDGPDQAELAARIAARPAAARVALAGHTDEPELWYRRADLVVAPSRWEGMALVPLEAMSCGGVVVAADVAGAREALPPGYPAWGGAEAGDAGELGRAVCAALDLRTADPDGWAALGRAGRAHVVARHSAARAAEEVMSLCRDVLDARQGPEHF